MVQDGKLKGRPALTGSKKLEFENKVYDENVDPDGTRTLHDSNTGDLIEWNLQVDGHTEKDKKLGVKNKWK